jgi:hypothetical protein
MRKWVWYLLEYRICGVAKIANPCRGIIGILLHRAKTTSKEKIVRENHKNFWSGPAKKEKE